MINVIIYLCMALMPMGGPEAGSIIFGPPVRPTVFIEPQAVYFNQTINLVYPNPESATVSVYTEQGILIDLTSVSAFGQVDIDTSDWTRGTYYIQVQSASASYQGVFNYVPDNERAPSN